MAAGKIWNFYRLGITGEQELFLSLQDDYFGADIPANFAAFYQSWTPTFLRQLSKPFFIDPVTYVMARDISNLKRDADLKKSYKKLFDYYGGNLAYILSNRQLIPRDFCLNGKWQTAFLDYLVDKTLDFQKDLMKLNTANQQSLLEYFEILGISEKKEELRPFFLVAPYFYFENLSDPWYDISLRMAKVANSRRGDYPLFAMICMGKEVLLETQSLTKMVKDYAGFDGYLVWISRFDDENEAPNYLTGLVTLIKALIAHQKPVVLIFAGSFSILLREIVGGGLGFCRGICYGESKDVDATATKGGAPKRFYYHLTMSKLSESVARAFFSDHPEELCDCTICSSLAKEKPRNPDEVSKFFDSLDLVMSRKHFMLSHKEAIQSITSLSQTKLFLNLAQRIKKCNNLKANYYGIPSSHLERWLEACKMKP